MTDLDQQATSGTVEPVRPYEQFRSYLQRRAETSSGTRGAEVAASQIDRLLAASETGDETALWDADEGGTFAGKDLTDVELSAVSFDLVPSGDEFESPLGVYVLLHCTRLDTGEEIVVNCGASAVVTKVLLFEQKGYFVPGKPLEFVLKGTKAAKGTVVKMRPLPVRAVRGTAE